MARNKVTKLWTALVTVFLALCTALGLVATTASAAVPQSETKRNSKSASGGTAPTAATRPRLDTAALPPTMKQRIRAEAHGASPGCRSHRPTHPDPAPDPTVSTDCSGDDTAPPAEPGSGHLPLQRRTPLRDSTEPPEPTGRILVGVPPSQAVLAESPWSRTADSH